MNIEPRTLGADTLVVGVDVGKTTHVAAAQHPDFRFGRPLAFANDREGFGTFATWHGQAGEKAGTAKTVVALEPTGHYWKPLGEFLSGMNVEIRMVSPVLTKRAKDMLDGSPLKTDAKDARVIADLARMGKSRPPYFQSPPVLELRYLVEIRERFNREKTATLNRLHRLLDLLFPELLRLFGKIDSKSLLALLEVAPTPGSVLAAGASALAGILEKASNGYYGGAKALEIVEAAKFSIGCTEGIMPLVFETLAAIPRIRELDSLLAAVEHEMNEVLSQVEYGPLLLSIPGFGVFTASVVIGELGDLRQYRNARQVIKMAGLNLFERSSGSHRGQKRITKRGRSLLRKVLYLAVLRQVGPRRLYGDFMQKHAASKPKPKIVVAAMRRLLRLIFAIARDGKVYVPVSKATADTEQSLQAA